jgi:hypothetical protein
MIGIKNINIILFIILHLMFMSFLMIFSYIKLGPLGSFLIFFFITMLYLVYSVPLPFKNIYNVYYKKIVIALALIFVCRVFIGFFHQAIFFDTNYFENPSNFVGIYEAEWMHGMLIKYANPESKIAPFFTFSAFSEDGIMRDKSAELHFYNSIIYRSFGIYSYNIIIWNSLHIVFLCLFLSLIALMISKSPAIGYRTLILSSFYPNGLFTNMMYRDITGLAILSFGVLIFTISFYRSNFQFFISILLMCFSGYLLREPYFALLFLISFLIGLKKLSKEHILFFSFSILVSLIFIAFGIYNILEVSFFRYEGGDSPFSFNLYKIIKNLKIFILGPFPFYQVFSGVSGAVWQIQHWPLIVYNWVIFFIIISNIRAILRSDMSILLFISFGFISSLILFGADLHIDYMVPGIIFLIPIVSTYNYPMKMMILVSAICYLLLTLIYFIISMLTTGSPFMGIFS